MKEAYEPPVTPKMKFEFPRLNLADVIVCVGVLVILFCVLLPATQMNRYASRRPHCDSNMRQLGLALMNYESAHQVFPAALGDQRFANMSFADPDRLSGMVLLLPYLERGDLFDQICVSDANNNLTMANTTNLADQNFKPWKEQLKFLKCPGSKSPQGIYGQTNYAFCIGDVANGIHQPGVKRGVFGFGYNTGVKDISDGTSHTVSMIEIGNSRNRWIAGGIAIRQDAKCLQRPSLCFETRDSLGTNYKTGVALDPLGRGGRWYDGAAGYSLTNTILGPNSPSCVVGAHAAVDGFYSAGSSHSGCVNVLFADGSVVVMSDSIDRGPSAAIPLTKDEMKSGMPSPFGVWGALGTMAGAEEINVPADLN